MARSPQIYDSLQRRVEDYLRQYNTHGNSFVMAAEAAEAELEEYLLKRAETELREAQSKGDAIKKQIQDRRLTA